MVLFKRIKKADTLVMYQAFLSIFKSYRVVVLLGDKFSGYPLEQDSNINYFYIIFLIHKSDSPKFLADFFSAQFRVDESFQAELFPHVVQHRM